MIFFLSNFVTLKAALSTALQFFKNYVTSRNDIREAYVFFLPFLH